jgi:MraZ protein
MFYGEYHHSLDNKDRVIIPSRFRDIFKENYSEKLFITRGLDQCLFIFTEEEWKTQERKFRGLPFTSADSRRFNRLLFSGAVDITVDRQGRILIPNFLKKYAAITQDVVIIGASDRMEIWAKEKWKEFYDSSVGGFEDVAERLFNKESSENKGGES